MMQTKLDKFVKKEKENINEYSILWDYFVDFTLLLIIVLSKFVRILTKTTVHKYACILRYKGFFPFFAPNIHHYGPHSLDINEALEELERRGIINLSNNGIKIHPKYANRIYKLALKLGISYPEFEGKIRLLHGNYGSYVGELGEKVTRKIKSLVEEENNYHYSSLRWRKEKEKIQTSFGGNLKVNLPFGISIEIPYILQKIENTESKVIGKYVLEIMNKKEKADNCTFFVDKIHQAHKNYEIWEKIKGSLCLLVGKIVKKVGEYPDTNETHFIFCQKGYNCRDEDIIRIILDKDGLHEPLEELYHNCYLLVGWIDERKGKPVIKVGGLIKIYKISEKLMEYLRAS